MPSKDIAATTMATLPIPQLLLCTVRRCVHYVSFATIGGILASNGMGVSMDGVVEARDPYSSVIPSSYVRDCEGDHCLEAKRSLG